MRIAGTKAGHLFDVEAKLSLCHRPEGNGRTPARKPAHAKDAIPYALGDYR
jgi:hypothetical protein